MATLLGEQDNSNISDAIERRFQRDVGVLSKTVRVSLKRTHGLQTRVQNIYAYRCELLTFNSFLLIPELLLLSLEETKLKQVFKLLSLFVHLYTHTLCGRRKFVVTLVGFVKGA